MKGESAARETERGAEGIRQSDDSRRRPDALGSGRADLHHHL